MNAIQKATTKTRRHEDKASPSCLRAFVVAFVFVIFWCALSILAAQTPSPDWPQWRGPNRDGAIASFTPPKGWPNQLARKWKVDVGIGYASPVQIGRASCRERVEGRAVEGTVSDT